MNLLKKLLSRLNCFYVKKFDHIYKFSKKKCFFSKKKKHFMSNSTHMKFNFVSMLLHLLIFFNIFFARTLKSFDKISKKSWIWFIMKYSILLNFSNLMSCIISKYIIMMKHQRKRFWVIRFFKINVQFQFVKNASTTLTTSNRLFKTYKSLKKNSKSKSWFFKYCSMIETKSKRASLK